MSQKSLSSLWRRRAAALAAGTVPVVLVATAAIVFAAGGSLDPTFGTGGVAIVNGGTAAATLRQVAVQSDGKSVECGDADTGQVNESGQGIFEWQVRRFNEDGSPDAGFGTGGLVRLFGNVGGFNSNIGQSNLAYGIAIDTSGRLLVVGAGVVKTVVVTGTGKKQKTTITYTQYATLVRLNPNGSLDTSFGVGGVTRAPLAGAALAAGTAVVLQPDGRVVVGGMGNYPTFGYVMLRHAFVARFLSNGSLDTAFGSGGVTVDTRVTPGDSSGAASVKMIALQSTGEIVVGGSRPPYSWLVTRFGTDGAIDAGFLTIAATTVVLNGLAVDRFDRIVASGCSGNVSSASNILVARYGPGGSVDASFGVGGVATIDGYPRESALRGAVFQPADDKIVLAASVSLGLAPSPFRATVIRLTDSGALDGTFGTGGLGDLVPLSPSGAPGGAALAPDGKILIGGGYSPILFVARYDGD